MTATAWSVSCAAPSGPPRPASPAATGSPTTPVGDGPADAAARSPDATAHQGLSADAVVAWTRHRLPYGFADAVVSSGTAANLTVVRGDTLPLVASARADDHELDRAPDGSWFPVEVLAVDPASYAAVVPGISSHLDVLADGEALLSASSAQVRDVADGGTLVFAGGTQVPVAAVVADELVGAGEVVVSYQTGGALGVGADKYVLARPSRDRSELEAAVRTAAGAEPVRIRGVGETPVLRHADSVLPPAQVKARFGEFAMREAAGRAIQQDPDWVAAHIVTATVPIIGQVRCHRNFAPSVRGALSELEQQGLAHLVDPGDYAGCWSPRRADEDGPLSHHAWGIAIDLNASVNRQGGASTQDPRLVELMRRWGMTWGGEWLLPDPMHFEYLEPPPEG